MRSPDLRVFCRQPQPVRFFWRWDMQADGNLKRRICPFISSGQFVQYCRGAGCNAAKPMFIEGETSWYCELIEHQTEFEND